MRNPPVNTVVLIGAGNVGTAIGMHLKKQGIPVLQVWSRTQAHADRLASFTGAESCTSLSLIRPGADLYIISVPDMALPAVNAELSLGPEPFAVHTSGSLPIDRLNALTSRTGVFYPLQTFSVSRTTSFGQLPVFIETSCEDDLPVLRSFAARFSGKIIEADSTKRRMAHLAAVFACNFTNHMYSLSFDIMKETGLSFELLLPLINETARKVHKVTPDKAQTGPAFRGDQEVIETHLKMLEKEPLYREIYSLLSKSIAGRVNKL